MTEDLILSSFFLRLAFFWAKEYCRWSSYWCTEKLGWGRVFLFFKKKTM